MRDVSKSVVQITVFRLTLKFQVTNPGLEAGSLANSTARLNSTNRTVFSLFFFNDDAYAKTVSEPPVKR